MQQHFINDVVPVGQKLNHAIDCPVIYPVFDKPLFQCHCGVVFPRFMVEGTNETRLKEYHNEIANTFKTRT